MQSNLSCARQVVCVVHSSLLLIRHCIEPLEKLVDEIDQCNMPTSSKRPTVVQSPEVFQQMWQQLKNQTFCETSWQNSINILLLGHSFQAQLLLMFQIRDIKKMLKRIAQSCLEFHVLKLWIASRRHVKARITQIYQLLMRPVKYLSQSCHQSSLQPIRS